MNHFSCCWMFLKTQLYCKAVNMSTNASQPGQRWRLSCLGRVNVRVKALWMADDSLTPSGCGTKYHHQLFPTTRTPSDEDWCQSFIPSKCRPSKSGIRIISSILSNETISYSASPQVHESGSHNDYLLIIILCYNIQHSFLWPGGGEQM